MLFKERFWLGIADGSVTVAFRRWKRPTVKAGGNLRSPGGFLAIDAVEPWTIEAISPEDARRGGYTSLEELVTGMGYSDAQLYRITFHLAGPDPRVRLREQSDLTPEELADIRKRLARMDTASADGPWTTAYLRLIFERPGILASRLAHNRGEEREYFKERVRRLKALGLTESLVQGYRLSPRGEAILRALSEPSE